MLAEAVQTVMRKHGLQEPYEQLKRATRGQQLDRATFADAAEVAAVAGRCSRISRGAHAGSVHRPGGRVGEANRLMPVHAVKVEWSTHREKLRAIRATSLHRGAKRSDRTRMGRTR